MITSSRTALRPAASDNAMPAAAMRQREDAHVTPRPIARPAEPPPRCSKERRKVFARCRLMRSGATRKRLRVALPRQDAQEERAPLRRPARRVPPAAARHLPHFAAERRAPSARRRDSPVQRRTRARLRADRAVRRVPRLRRTPRVHAVICLSRPPPAASCSSKFHARLFFFIALLEPPPRFTRLLPQLRQRLRDGDLLPMIVAAASARRCRYRRAAAHAAYSSVYAAGGARPRSGAHVAAAASSKDAAERHARYKKAVRSSAAASVFTAAAGAATRMPQVVRVRARLLTRQRRAAMRSRECRCDNATRQPCRDAYTVTLPAKITLRHARRRFASMITLIAVTRSMSMFFSKRASKFSSVAAEATLSRAAASHLRQRCRAKRTRREPHVRVTVSSQLLSSDAPLA